MHLLTLCLNLAAAAPATTTEAPAAPTQPTADATEAPPAAEPAEAAPSPLDRNPFDMVEREPAEPGTDAPAETSEPAAPTGPGLPSEVSADPAPAPSKKAAVAKRVWPERPVRYRIDASMGVANLWVSDWAYGAFDYDQHRLLPQVTVRGDMPLGGDKLFLGAALSYRGTSTYGESLDASTDLQIREPMVGVRASYRLIDGIDLYAQVSGGPSIYDIEYYGGYFDDYGDDEGYYYDDTVSASQRTWAVAVDGLAGFTLYLPKKWMPRKGSARFSFGLDFSGGYQFRNQVIVQPDVDTDAEDIQVQEHAAGDVAVRGAVFNFAIFARFQ